MEKQIVKLDKPVAIEEIRVMVKPECIDKWVELDTRIWTSRLKVSEGFLGKEIWISRDVPGEITVIIYWEDYDIWQSHDKSGWCKELDEQMFAEMGEGNLISMEFKFKDNQKFMVYKLQ